MEDTSKSLREFELGYLPKMYADTRELIFTELFRTSLMAIDKEIDSNANHQEEATKLRKEILDLIVSSKDRKIIIDIMVVTAILTELIDMFNKK